MTAQYFVCERERERERDLMVFSNRLQQQPQSKGYRMIECKEDELEQAQTHMSVHNNNGYEWTGEVGEVESHISQCTHHMIVCPNMCKGRGGKEIKILQKDLQTHLDNECQCRQFPSPYCKEEQWPI